MAMERQDDGQDDSKTMKVEGSMTNTPDSTPRIEELGDIPHLFSPPAAIGPAIPGKKIDRISESWLEPTALKGVWHGVCYPLMDH